MVGKYKVINSATQKTTWVAIFLLQNGKNVKITPQITSVRV